MKNETHHFAEYVSPGHPDRLADAIAESIVDYALHDDPRALVGVECAVHRNKVFVDGPVVFRPQRPRREPLIPLARIIRRVYREAGYSRRWEPAPETLEIHEDLCVGKLTTDAAKIRDVAEDQSVVCGFATADPRFNHLPAAHYLAQRLGAALLEWRNALPERQRQYGPDFKLLPHLSTWPDEQSGAHWQWQRLILSIQHADAIHFEQLHRDLFPVLHCLIQHVASECRFPSLVETFSPEKLHLNGAGDFRVGGPNSDNGLSGKKLVVDHYGPEVPIGGGALCGKDPHKIDRAGAVRARQLAKRLAKALGRDVRVRLVWSPGEQTPSHIEASAFWGWGWKPIPSTEIPPKDWFSIRAIAADLLSSGIVWGKAVRQGYFSEASERLWES